MIENPRDAMVNRLSSLLAGCLGDHPHYTVVAGGQWQPLEGFPRHVLAFDLMIVKGDVCWQTGQEGAVLAQQTPPVTAIDIVAPQTLRRDLFDKPDLLNVTGLHEYALYDPTAEVLRPALQVFRRRNGGVYQVPTAMNGVFFSGFGFQFRFDGSEVRVASSGPAYLEEELYALRFSLVGGGEARERSPETTAKIRRLEERIADYGRHEGQ